MQFRVLFTSRPLVVVELDGYDDHNSAAQIERDRRKEIELRAAGFVVVRYTWEQVTGEVERVSADLLRILASSPARSA